MHVEGSANGAVKLKRCHPAGVFEGVVKEAELPLRYELDVAYPDGNSFRLREPNFVPFTADEIVVISNKPAWAGRLREIESTFHFRPHFGWVGAIENEQTALTS